MKYRIFIMLFAVLLAKVSSAQSDTITVLGFESFMHTVKAHHPVAKQAELQLLYGEANLLKSQGLFDPKAFADVAQKYFDGTQYYSHQNSGLMLPTWFGAELKSGYEQQQGTYLNPESTVPGGGLWYAGISLPVGQGLFIDERRAALRKARIYLDISESERQLMLNKLLLEAGKAYWDWFANYHNMLVHREAVGLARQRFEAVRQSALLGDRPYIDTLEASIQVQTRTLSLQESVLNWENASAMLEVYLWAEGIIPLDLADTTVPDYIDNVVPLVVDGSYSGLVDNLAQNHPKSNQYSAKMRQLELDKRLRQEQLKPALNLEYKPISEPVNGDPVAAYSINNYTWGLSFSMPLFLRKERAQVQLANLNLQDTELEQNTAVATLIYQATASLNAWRTSYTQLQLYTQTVADYNRLLFAEQQLFSGGESSLFMVNSREVGYINARIKLIELATKNRTAAMATAYAFGDLWEKYP